MKRSLLVLAVLLALPTGSLAGNLERAVKSRWLGAWIVTGVEAYSDCSGMYTNNRVNGKLVKSRGYYRFQPGELAKLDKIDVKKSRLDLHLSLVEPLLTPYQDGPFTLYRESHCKVELEVMLPREAVKGKDADRIDVILAGMLERHATEAAALRSDAWNEREMGPYPEDYQRTLAEHAVWQTNQENAAVQAKIDHALDVTSRMADRLSSDTNYLAGFAKGVEEARGVDLGGCSSMMAFNLAPQRQHDYRAHHTHDAHQARSTRHDAGDEGEHDEDDEDVTKEARESRGHEDGRQLVFGLELLRRLPACFVPVAELPPVEVAARD